MAMILPGVSVPKRKNNDQTPPDDNVDDSDQTFEESMEIESVTGEPTPEPNKSKNQEKAENLQKEVQRLQDKIAALEKQIEDEKKEQLYLRAEFDTYRRRAIKERSDTLKYAGERVFSALLGVLDDFERALKVEVTSENIESFKNGVKLISDELRNVLKREGVEEIEPKDDQFDPNVFEAISSEETKEKEPGQITRVFRKAYRLHDRVIRPGQVVVAKAPSDNDDGGWEIDEK